MNKKNIKFLVTLLISLTCTQALHGQTIGSLNDRSTPPQAAFNASQPTPLPSPPYVPPAPTVPLVPTTPPPIIPPAPIVPAPMPPAPPSTPSPNNTAQPAK